jgi:hypothetical protein
MRKSKSTIDAENRKKFPFGRKEQRRIMGEI